VMWNKENNHECGAANKMMNRRHSKRQVCNTVIVYCISKDLIFSKDLEKLQQS
jgi:hypothetical protein